MIHSKNYYMLTVYHYYVYRSLSMLVPLFKIRKIIFPRNRVNKDLDTKIKGGLKDGSKVYLLYRKNKEIGNTEEFKLLSKLYILYL